MVEIVLPYTFASRYGGQIERAADGRVRLTPVHGNDPRDPDISQTEIVLHAFFYALTPLDDFLGLMPNIRWIHSMGAGLDDVVTPALLERDVLLTNVAGAYAPAMAEYAIAAMVMLARNWPAWSDAQKDRHWIERVAPQGVELYGKRVCIVGYGAIGRHLARACHALGMRVSATRRTPIPATAEPLDELVPAEELGSALSAADFVVITASLNATTRGLIGSTELAAVKQGAFLVNVSRGELIDQDALAAALSSGRLGGAVLDVTTPEPLGRDSSLWDARNLWITPHMSGDTDEGWQRGIDLFCHNLRLYLSGQPQRMGNIVDIRAHV